MRLPKPAIIWLPQMLMFALRIVVSSSAKASAVAEAMVDSSEDRSATNDEKLAYIQQSLKARR